MDIELIQRTGSELLVRFSDEQSAGRMEAALGAMFPQDAQPEVEPKPEMKAPLPEPEVPESLVTRYRIKSQWKDGMVVVVLVSNTTEQERVLSVRLSTTDKLADVWGGTYTMDGSDYVIRSDKAVRGGETWDFTFKTSGSDGWFEIAGDAGEDAGPAEGATKAELTSEPVASAPQDAPGTLAYAPVIDPNEDVKRNLMQGAFGAVYEGGWGYKDAVSIVDDGDGPCLRTHMEKGSHAGTKDKIRGGGFDTRTMKVEHAILEYALRFKPGFDPVKGGKLPGLMGGDSPSGHKEADNGFTARMMWRSEAQGELYLYYPDMKQSHGDSIGRGNFHFDCGGAWHTIQQEVKLNDVGKANGFIRVWYDDEPVIEVTDLRLRTKDDVLIEGMMHTIFFGGSDDSWGAARDEWVDTGDFKIYTP